MNNVPEHGAKIRVQQDHIKYIPNQIEFMNNQGNLKIETNSIFL